ncbi:MAG: NYN domain-containing protein [Luteitalea sp.]|nr:NYN domain-containing protein [Luteitalea sp.]
MQRNLTPGGDKNGADINLALDALEMAFTHPHINAYVIVGGDSDFLSLVEKLKQYDKKVFVVGGRAFTSIILQRNCHEFIAYENLVRKPSGRTGTGRPQAIPASSPIAQAFPIVRRALKILADREVSPQTGLLKSTLLQLDSTFSERNYGASSFLDFVEKLTQAGLVQMKHSGRSVMVELNSGFSDEAYTSAVKQEPAAALPAAAPPGVPTAAPGFPTTYSPAAAAGSAPGEEETAPVTQAGDNAEGVRLAGQLLAAATTARWPMYLRNVKQILRAGAFDERRYGFGGLIDLLRACQRDGFVRMERDRRGGLRVFQGPAVRPQTTPSPQGEPETAAAALASEPETATEMEPLIDMVDAVIAADALDSDVIEIAPVSVIDTTAELLGRAKPRRPRTRAAGAPGGGAAATPSRGRTPVGGRTPGGGRKSAAKKAAPPARRTASRVKKSSDGDDENRGNR